MEVKSQADKSELSSRDSETFEGRSIRLGKKTKSFKALSLSCDRRSNLDNF
jgi:hypothetical protein